MTSWKCFDCEQNFTFFRPKYCCRLEAGGCGNYFCGNCLNYACVTEEKSRELGLKAPLNSFCKKCFQRNSGLDYDSKVTIYGAKMNEAPSVLFVHGGGGCRKMFDAHARLLAEKNGFRCVLVDLPGHGARLDEELTLSSALEVIRDALENLCGLFRNTPPVAVGGSLGGYLLMEFVSRYPTLTSGMVVTMCGQNVGVGRSFAATAGLVLLGSLTNLFSSKLLLSGLIAQAQKTSTLDETLIIESSLRTGMFFHQGAAQISILRETNPAASLPHYSGRVLFINGSKDHRDSEQRWLDSCQQVTSKQLIVYEGGDHFFTHDKRFLSRFLQDLETFLALCFPPSS